MFNVGGPEILLVLLVALVVLGPEQLPKAMRTFGNTMAQVRKLSNGFQDEMRSAMNTMDITAAARTTPGSSGSGGVRDGGSQRRRPGGERTGAHGQHPGAGCQCRAGPARRFAG